MGRYARPCSRYSHDCGEKSCRNLHSGYRVANFGSELGGMDCSVQHC